MHHLMQKELAEILLVVGLGVSEVVMFESVLNLSELFVQGIQSEEDWAQGNIIVRAEPALVRPGVSTDWLAAVLLDAAVFLCIFAAGNDVELSTVFETDESVEITFNSVDILFPIWAKVSSPYSIPFVAQIFTSASQPYGVRSSLFQCALLAGGTTLVFKLQFTAECHNSAVLSTEGIQAFLRRFVKVGALWRSWGKRQLHQFFFDA